MNESDLDGKVRAGRGVFSIFWWINVFGIGNNIQEILLITKRSAGTSAISSCNFFLPMKCADGTNVMLRIWNLPFDHFCLRQNS